MLAVGVVIVDCRYRNRRLVDLDIMISELDIVINEMDIVISQAGTEISSL